MQDVFPSMPLDTILNDLQLTHSMEHTIENIVEGRLQYPPVSHKYSYRIRTLWHECFDDEVVFSLAMIRKKIKKAPKKICLVFIDCLLSG